MRSAQETTPGLAYSTASLCLVYNFMSPHTQISMKLFEQKHLHWSSATGPCDSISPLTTPPFSMKIKNPNAGALTNFEVLDFLRSRGASKDVSRVLAPVATSEYKLELCLFDFVMFSVCRLYDYLVETPACNQTRENINEFLERFKKYNLAKAELLNIINIRPSQTVEIYTELVVVRFPSHLDNRFKVRNY
ncbi:hypothetical protein OIU76_002729 [Salix suchowensis]|nr:hypothetical protein OIU76_002729 [Salix suchowensis]